MIPYKNDLIEPGKLLQEPVLLAIEFEIIGWRNPAVEHGERKGC